MQTANAISSFLRFRGSSGLADKTILLDKSVMNEFEGFCFDNGANLLSDINEILIEDFFVYLYSERKSTKTGAALSQSTLVKYHDVLKVFESYLVRRENIRPFVNIPRPKVVQNKIRTFSFEQLHFLVNVSHFRYKVLFRLLANCGTRITETLSLAAWHIDFERHTLLLANTKTKIERIVPFSAALSDDLESLIHEYGGNPLFPMKPNSVRHYMGRISEKYPDIFRDTEVHPHIFRHTFAKHWILNGGDQRSLQEILGHTTPAMTAKYVSLFSNDLIEKHQKHALMI